MDINCPKKSFVSNSKVWIPNHSSNLSIMTSNEDHMREEQVHAIEVNKE